MKIIASRPGDVYLVQVSDTKARVLNLETKVFHRPMFTQQILARGYWEPHSTTKEVLKTYLAGVVHQ